MKEGIIAILQLALVRLSFTMIIEQMSVEGGKEVD